MSADDSAAPGPQRIRRERRVSVLFRPDRTKHFAGVSALHLSRDRRFLFSASRDASIRRWEIGGDWSGDDEDEDERGEVSEDDDGPPLSPLRPRASPCARRRPPSAPSASFSASFAGHGDWVTSLATPTPRLLASSSYDKTVRLWDARAGTEEGGGRDDGDDGDDGGVPPLYDSAPLETLVGHSDYVTCLASLGGSEGGTPRVASAGLGGEVFVWDLARSSPSSSLSSTRRPLRAARASVFSLSSDSTGDLLAVGGPAGALRVVDCRSPTRADGGGGGWGDGADLRGHSDVVRSLDLSPCGRVLVSASSDRTVRVWDVGQRRCVSVLAPHVDSVWAVEAWTDEGARESALSPPPSSSSSWGDDLVSAGRDGVVYRTHAPTRAAEAVAVMATSSPPSESTTPKTFSPAACCALACDASRSAVWVACSGDPTLRAWRVPSRRPSCAPGSCGSGGVGSPPPAARSRLASPPPRGGSAAAEPALPSVPPPGRAFHVPSSPLVRERQAFGGAARAGSVGSAGVGSATNAAAVLPSSFQRGARFPADAMPSFLGRRDGGGSPSLADASGAPPPSPLLSAPPPLVEVTGVAPAAEARWLPDRRRFLVRDASGRISEWDSTRGRPLREIDVGRKGDDGGDESDADGSSDADAERAMRRAERLAWTPAVGSHWAQLDVALGCPRLTLDGANNSSSSAASAFSSELYALSDLGDASAPDDLKVNSGVELLRAAAARWVLSLAREEEEGGGEREREKGPSERGEVGEAEGETENADDGAAAAALVASLSAAAAENAEHQRSLPTTVSAFRELERSSERLLVISETGDGAGTPLAVPASRVGRRKRGKKDDGADESEADAVDASVLLPRWSLDAILHGPPPVSSSSSSASTKMAFALEPHPGPARSSSSRRLQAPQLAPRRLSAPKVLALSKLAAHAITKLKEQPHCLEVSDEPLPCYWDEGKQREAEEREAEREEEAKRDEGGDEKRRRLPRLELCVGDHAAPLDLSLASAREHLWKKTSEGREGGAGGDMVLTYKLSSWEERSPRPVLEP